MRVNTSSSSHRVFGGLLGQYKGDKCEIFSAFEFVNQSADESKIDLDLNYIDERRKLTEQLFPNYEIVGFFVTNNNSIPNEGDKEVLKAMDFFGVVTPLCLVMGTDLSTAEELPIAVYQIEKHSKNFIRIEHVLEGYESERICLETVTKASDFQNNESPMIQNMITIKNALDVLKGNLKLIKGAIKDEKFTHDLHFMSMLDELVKNYPNVCNPDHIKMLHEKEEEILILNNLCADSIDLSLLGRIDTFNLYEDRKGGMFNFK
jgi:hypothetical protein